MDKDSLVFEDGVYFQERAGKLYLAAAPIPKLIERLTHERVSDPGFTVNFLICYPAFMSAVELISLLSERYIQTPPSHVIASERVIFEQKVAKPIRIKTFAAIHKWLMQFPDDIFKDNLVVTTLQKFIEEIVAPVEFKHSENLTSLLNKKAAEYAEKNCEGEPAPAGDPDKHHLLDNLLSIPADELSDTITNEVRAMLARVDRIDFLNYATNHEVFDGDEVISIPRLKELISFGEMIAQWVASDILNVTEFEERVEHLTYFIQVMGKVIAKQNYDTAMSILRGLNRSSVSRLKHTWNELDPEIQQSFSMASSLLSPSNNYALYRDVLWNDGQKRFIPSITILLRDLERTCEEHSVQLQEIQSSNDKFINFTKYEKQAELLQDTLQLNQLHSPTERHFSSSGWSVYQALSSLSFMNREAMTNRSFDIEPRGAKRENLTSKPLPEWKTKRIQIGLSKSMSVKSMGVPPNEIPISLVKSTSVSSGMRKGRSPTKSDPTTSSPSLFRRKKLHTPRRDRRHSSKSSTNLSLSQLKAVINTEIATSLSPLNQLANQSDDDFKNIMSIFDELLDVNSQIKTLLEDVAKDKCLSDDILSKLNA